MTGNSSLDFADFDRYCEEHEVAVEDTPEAFAQWLADHTGRAVVAGPTGESPTIVALPEEEDPCATP